MSLKNLKKMGYFGQRKLIFEPIKGRKFKTNV